MPTTRINGISLDLENMSDLALWTLRSTVIARQHRVDHDLTKVNDEIKRRQPARECEPMLPEFAD